MEFEDIEIGCGGSDSEQMPEDLARMILEDYAALKRGEVIDAFEVREEIRVEHGF